MPLSTDPSQTVFTLPDILAEWPYKRVINPLSGLQPEVESTAWIKSLVAFTPRLQHILELGNHRMYNVCLLQNGSNHNIFLIRLAFLSVISIGE